MRSKASNHEAVPRCLHAPKQKGRVIRPAFFLVIKILFGCRRRARGQKGGQFAHVWLFCICRIDDAFSASRTTAARTAFTRLARGLFFFPGDGFFGA
ncbi:MAG TPA: hypothetical protein VN036_04350, partial [Devosia sp.]|nr:hypothetical protein [Devosia sp.]